MRRTTPVLVSSTRTLLACTSSSPTAVLLTTTTGLHRAPVSHAFLPVSATRTVTARRLNPSPRPPRFWSLLDGVRVSSTAARKSTSMEKDEAPDAGSSASKKRVGMHVSTKGGLPSIFDRATRKGGSAVAFFLKNQRTWKPPKLPEAQTIEEFEQQRKKHGIETSCMLPHGNYLVNLGNGADDEAELLAKSKACFLDEMKRCEVLGIPMLNIHPGSTKGKISIEESCQAIAQAINESFKEIRDVSVILEITAGGGNAVGKTFEELKMIIDAVDDKDRIGVCLDTCHMFAAGYDIRTQEAYDATMNKFEEVVGFKYLKAIHLNDSKSGLGSKLDRHENIGKGYVGLEAFRCLMNDDRMNGIPLVLETPAAYKGSYRDEVKLLYSLEGRTEPFPPPPDAPEKQKKGAKKKTTIKRKREDDQDDSSGAENKTEESQKTTKKATSRRARKPAKRTAAKKSKKDSDEDNDDDDFEPPKKTRPARRAQRKPIKELED